MHPPLLARDASADSHSESQWPKLARGGSRWALAGQLAAQGTSIVVFAVLCRWIAPADFGVFNTALLIVTLPRMLVQVGMNAAIVQRQQLDAPGLSTLFWCNQLLSVACAATAIGAGLIVAQLSGSTRLAVVTAALSGTTLVAALGATHLSLLDRALRSQRASTLRWAAQACAGGVAVVLALQGRPLAALLAQQYVELAILAVGAWQAESWRPGRGSGWASIRSSLQLSRHVATTNLVFYVAQNADKLLLYVMLGGAAAGETAIGMYTLAYGFMMKPVYLASTPISSVMLPALARCVDRPAAYRELAVYFYRLAGAVLLPAGVGLLVVAEDAMLVQAGGQWREAGTLLTLLAPAVLVHGLFNITGSVLTSSGRTAWFVRVALLVALVQLQGYAAGYGLGAMAVAPPWGHVYGVAASYSAVLVLVVFLPYLTVSLAQVGMHVWDVLRPLIPLVMASSCMGLVVWGLRRWLAAWPVWADGSPLVRLMISAAVGAAVYALLARRELKSLLHG
ncbi:MAG: oligosaccharide flippase family protein [Pirellulales bacterium]